MSTIVRPKYDAEEEVTQLLTQEEALAELGRTQFVSPATAFGAAAVQVPAYPLHEHRKQVKENITGVKKHE